MAFSAPNDKYPFLKGGGEMGEFTRNYDWSQSVLGSPDAWPQSLKTTISIILNSRFPMFLFWGPDLICFYNDAYRPSLGSNGKHPTILGAKAVDVWQEIWDFIGPLIDDVLTGKGASWSEDQLLPIYRNGKLEDVYWTFSYSPVSDESGMPAGVFVTCTETTEKVQSIRDLSESEARFRNLIDQAPVAIATLTGRKLIVTDANEMILKIWGKELSVIGKPLIDALPEIGGQAFPQLLDDVYTSAIPYYGNEAMVKLEHNDILSERFVNFAYKPIVGNDGLTKSIMVIAVDVTEQVESRKAAIEVNERLNIALNAGALGITEVDLATGTMQCSAQFKKNYGREANEEFTYPDLFNAMLPEYREEVKRLVTIAKEHHSVYHAEYQVAWPDGSLHWISAHGRARYDDNGIANRMVGVTSEITERKEYEQQKDDFLSIASHELKTPITSLKASLQVLNMIKDKPFTENHIKLIDLANKSISKMGTLIEDLLNINRLGKGQLHLHKSPFVVSEMLESCCNIVRMTDTHELVIEGDLGLEIIADEHRINQVVINFVNNAVKYAPDAQKIRLSIEKIDGYAKISVIDNGPGIPKEALPKLFDRYYRADHSGYIYTGLGLGLYICAEIIRKHDGIIGVDSELGHGSTFWFKIPAQV